MAMSGMVTPTTKNASEVATATLSGQRRRAAIGAAIATSARYSAQTGCAEIVPPALLANSRPRAERRTRTTARRTSTRALAGPGTRISSSPSPKNFAARALSPVGVTPTA